jgi:hypothetical protein
VGGNWPCVLFALTILHRSQYSLLRSHTRG